MRDGYREFCRRQHRQVAAYLAVFAWRHNADFVVIERDFLEQRLVLERIKSAREKWFLADVQPWFPYHERLVSQSQTLSSFYLFRRKIANFPPGRMSDADRVSVLKESGRIGMLSSQIPEVTSRRKRLRFQAERVAREATVIRELTNIASGLSDLSHFKLKRMRS